MAQAEVRSRGSSWSARAALIGLFVLFLAPVVTAFVLNVFAPHWLPFGKVNRGELVAPPVPAGLDTVRPVAGPDPAGGEPSPVWVLVHVGSPRCDLSCQEALISIRQARLALGKDANRVERWWLVTGQADPHNVAIARKLDPGLHVGILDPSSPLARGGDSPAPVQLVDPAGYLILRYGDAKAASDVLKDLKRLLKISKQG